MRRVWVVALALLVVGCATQRRAERRCAPPCPESRGTTNDSPAAMQYRYTDPEVFVDLTGRLRNAEKAPDPNAKRYEVLALSGGGKYGAFSAGVLCGWTKTGTRPTFDLVTGVSTGALVGMFAFLGPEYDDQLERFYTTTTTDQILKKNRLVTLPFANALASSDPLRRLIDANLTDQVMADLAAAHAAGRRLFIGTTNIDTKRLCVWDVAAIAAGPRADKRELVVNILLASASVPGEFPPVEFDVTVNGQRYTELHVDGGASSEVFARLALLDVPPAQLKADRPLAGSNVYAVIAGKLFADPSCTDPKLLGILGGAVSSLVFAMTQNDLLRIYTLSLLTGHSFQFMAIPPDFMDDNDALNFDPAGMRRLFDVGFAAATAAGGQGWRKEPPGTSKKEQSIPRTGLDFTIPDLPPPGAPNGPVLPERRR